MSIALAERQHWAVTLLVIGGLGHAVATFRRDGILNRSAAYESRVPAQIVPSTPYLQVVPKYNLATACTLPLAMRNLHPLNDHSSSLISDYTSKMLSIGPLSCRAVLGGRISDML